MNSISLAEPQVVRVVVSLARATRHMKDSPGICYPMSFRDSLVPEQAKAPRCQSPTGSVRGRSV